jgi:hypothetical protein
MITEENTPNNPHIFGFDRFIPFFGVVEDRNDPLCVGRCKIRIFGVHPEDKTLVTTDQLPWAYPVMPIVGNPASGGSGHSAVGPVVGTHVLGFFADGIDRQQPFFFGVIAGGTGQFAYGSPQATPAAGGDGSSAYGPQGSGPLASQNLGNLDPNKPVFQKGAEIAALILANPTFKGLKDFHASALLGNLIFESGGGLEVRREGFRGMTKEEKITPPPQSAHGSPNGWGIAQWTNTKPNAGRYTNFCNWAARNGKKVTDYDANVGFFIYELQTDFKKMMQALIQGGTHTAPSNPKGPHNVDTIEGACKYITGYYERPSAEAAASSERARVKNATAVLAALNKSGAPVRSTAQPKKAG